MSEGRPESRYHEVYANWRSHPDGFWAAAAQAIDWSKAPRAVFEQNGDGASGRWFLDGTLNACFNCVDRHVRDGRGAQAAIIYDAPVIAFEKTISFDELLDEVATLAAVLGDFGIGKGHRILIFLPTIPRLHVAMLACARIGAVHAVLPDGTGAEVISACIDDAEPKLILTASCAVVRGRPVAYKPLIDAAIETAQHKPTSVLVWQRPRLEADLLPGRDHDWEALVDAASDAGRRAECVPMMASEPLCHLHSPRDAEGPKGRQCETGGYLVALGWTMTNVYGVSPGGVFWAALDPGEPIGQMYGVLGPLLIGATTICFEGEPVGTPDAGAFSRACAQWNVTSLLTKPAAIRSIRKEEPGRTAVADLTALRATFLAGETADFETADWLSRQTGAPVINQWCDPGTGWCVAANPLGLGLLPNKQGSVAVPLPGYVLAVVDDAGRSVPHGSAGRIVIDAPLPPGWPTRRDGTDDPGRYETGKAGRLDDEGYLFLQGPA